MKNKKDKQTDRQIDEIVQMFLTQDIIKPKDVLAKTGYRIRLLGTGAYRKVYKFIGLPLVVKFPLTEDERDIQHSVLEFKARELILRQWKKYEKLTRYMPDIYFLDDTAGVMLARYYLPLHNSKLRFYEGHIAAMVGDIVDLAWDHKKRGTHDTHYENMGVDDSGQVKITDMGFFYQN